MADTAGAPVASTDLHDFDYIRNLHAAAVCQQPDGRSLFAVLVGLRATSHRAMLLVYDQDARLVYQHHLERRSGTREALYTGQIDGAEALAVDLGTVTAWTCVR